MEAENQVFLALGRLEGKVDTFLSAQKRADERAEERFGAIEARVTNLETAKARGTGQLVGFTTAIRWGWVVAGAVAGLYADKIKEFIFR